MRAPLDIMKLNKHCTLSGQLSELGASFGWTRSGGMQPHQGWDLEAKEGTSCYAISNGIIVYAMKDNQGSYGRCVLLQFNKSGGPKTTSAQRDLFAFYAHLSRVFVNAGNSITEGGIIGETGVSGNAANSPSPPHLHFEIRTVSTNYPKGQTPLAHRLDPGEVLGYRYLTCTPAT